MLLFFQLETLSNVRDATRINSSWPLLVQPLSALEICLPEPDVFVHTVGLINNHPDLMMHDGGSNHSVLSGNAFDKLGDQCSIIDERVANCVRAGGVQSRSRSYVMYLKLTLGEGVAQRSVHWSFLYTPDCSFEKTLIGSDILGHLDSDVNYSRGGWSLRGDPFWCFR